MHPGALDQIRRQVEATLASALPRPDDPAECRHACSFPIMSPPCQHRRGKTIGVYGNGMNKWHREKLGRNLTRAEAREAMGIQWMTRAELSQAVPPAYTEYIGLQLIEALEPVDRRTHHSGDRRGVT